MCILNPNNMTASSKQVPTMSEKSSEISINHQKLIEATIETIAKRGLADTTISHVAKKAKVSQGYANFRFKSKENLLLSSLQFLSDEYKKSWQKIFEDENLDPIDRLLRIFENDFSKKIANRNKISVWVAFYSEVKFRPSYLSVCQEQDDIYLNQTKKLIDKININTGQKFLTSTEIGETYHSIVDGLWQRILFDPKVYTNEFCKSLVMKYFRSVYPNEIKFK